MNKIIRMSTDNNTKTPITNNNSTSAAPAVTIPIMGPEFNINFVWEPTPIVVPPITTTTTTQPIIAPGIVAGLTTPVIADVTTPVVAAPIIVPITNPVPKKIIPTTTSLHNDVNDLKKIINTLKNQVVDLRKSASINSKVNQANIKLLDHLITRGNEEDIGVINELLADPEELNPLSLSYLSLTHLENRLFYHNPLVDFNDLEKEDLEEYGIILSLDKLIEESSKFIVKIENKNDVFKPDNKLVLKRLINGIELVIETWKNNKLMNKIACEVLDKYAINEFKNSLAEGNGSAILKNMFAQKIDQLQTDTVKKYLEKKLSDEDMDAIDKFILHNIEKWLFTSNPAEMKDVLVDKINENVRQILLQMFKNNKIPDTNQHIFNIENVIAILITLSENDLSSKFREEIYNEILMITNGNPAGELKIKLMAEYKDVAIKNICNKWFSNKDQLDQKIDKSINKTVANVLVNKLRTEDTTGLFHTQVIREAISYLLDQFKTKKSLRPYIYGVLEDKIKTWIIYRKPQESQKDTLIKTILFDLKNSNNPDDKSLLLSALKSHDLITNLEKMQQILSFTNGSYLLSQSRIQYLSDINPNITVQVTQIRQNDTNIHDDSTVNYLTF